MKFDKPTAQIVIDVETMQRLHLKCQKQVINLINGMKLNRKQ